MSDNSYDARSTLDVGGRTLDIFRLDALQAKFDVARLPFSLKILLENLLRNEDDAFVKRDDIEAMATWNVQGKIERDLRESSASKPGDCASGSRASAFLDDVRCSLGRLALQSPPATG